jgi:pyruvate dehydrogenase E2 component (dihydrolipoamide acetyltransferase)/2-oxoisovalerate dehydrogenase E2 component (dihydrolipoyl transacylase)
MDFPLPELGEGVYEAELVRWLVKPGERVQHGQTLMEVMTDKATMEVPAPFSGSITILKAEPGQQVKVGSVVLTYEGTAQDKTVQPVAPAPSVAVTNGKQETAIATSAGPASAKAAPSVRHLARKLGIDLGQVRGSGPGGRVLHEDLASFLTPHTDGKPTPVVREAPFDLGVAGSRIKVVGIRRRIAEHMVEAKRAIPHISYIDECDVSELVHLRAQTLETFAQNNVKLTYLPFIVMAAVRALKEVAIANATFDEKAGEIVLHDRYHIGIAAAMPSGLIVPVIRDGDKKSLWDLAREIDRLSADARAGKSRREDLGGSTFTITSFGSIGGLMATPIINHPEVAIMGIGKIVKRPVYNEHGQLVPADMVYLSFSFDHRVIDGAVGAVFGNAIIKQLKNPAALLLPGKF